MVAWTNSTPYNSRLDDYCMPIIRRVSQAPFCGSIKKVTDKDEDIEASFAPLELLILALLSNIIQRRKIRLKFGHAYSEIVTTCSFVKTVFLQLL